MKAERPSESSPPLSVATDLRVLIGKLRRRLRDQGNAGEFTWAQVAVLTRLERDGPASVTALAHAEGVRPQSMGATVATLEEAGIVSGSPDPTDGRRTILSLTDTAVERLTTTRAAKEDWLARSIDTLFTPAEQRQLAIGVELLTRLANS
ncbi:MarR family winged helix-turn-helix transcriptional regulator [Leifsonia sp. Root112D2]|uniref:MarR family winged helix-turn-helix transcriptional regulator n=1 Tax=Leifsonia sp. Root112D2 TaxID=1736426 RepID=UPI001910ECD1|nr:MarR family transcriptional regulator [Leifsonia sp. Root112D2]